MADQNLEKIKLALRQPNKALQKRALALVHNQSIVEARPLLEQFLDTQTDPELIALTRRVITSLDAFSNASKAVRVDQLGTLLSSADPTQRLTALRALVGRREPGLAEALHAAGALRDADPACFSLVVEILAANPHPANTEFLVAATRHLDEKVRIHALQGVMNLFTGLLLPRLLEGLVDPGPQAKMKSLQLVNSVSRVNLLGALQSMLGLPDGDALLAARLLPSFLNHDLIPLLKMGLEHPHSEVNALARRAATMLNQKGDTEAAALLAAAARRPVTPPAAVVAPTPAPAAASRPFAPAAAGFSSPPGSAPLPPAAPAPAPRPGAFAAPAAPGSRFAPPAPATPAGAPAAPRPFESPFGDPLAGLTAGRGAKPAAPSPFAPAPAVAPPQSSSHREELARWPVWMVEPVRQAMLEADPRIACNHYSNWVHLMKDWLAFCWVVVYFGQGRSHPAADRLAFGVIQYGVERVDPFRLIQGSAHLLPGPRRETDLFPRILAVDIKIQDEVPFITHLTELAEGLKAVRQFPERAGEVALMARDASIQTLASLEPMRRNRLVVKLTSGAGPRVLDLNKPDPEALDPRIAQGNSFDARHPYLATPELNEAITLHPFYGVNEKTLSPERRQPDEDELWHFLTRHQAFEGFIAFLKEKPPTAEG